MVIGVCGLGYTGSGAVLDFLKGFDELCVIDKMEFEMVYTPDGLEDLGYHLTKAVSRYFSSDIAIKRFKKYILFQNSKKSWYRILTHNHFRKISDQYLEQLIELSWKGRWFFDYMERPALLRFFDYKILTRIQRRADRLFQYYIPFLPNRTMYLSTYPEKFYEISREYISLLLREMSPDPAKSVVLDQPFSGDNPEKSFVFFDNPYAIVVDRDPRDLYILVKKVILSGARFIPYDSVQDFVAYYKILRKNLSVNLNSKYIMKINLEDLIYEYETTAASICEFLSLDKSKSSGKYFDPNISIQNTQLFKKYTEFKEDIKYIETELKEWLYPFEKYKSNKNLGQHSKAF